MFELENIDVFLSWQTHTLNMVVIDSNKQFFSNHVSIIYNPKDFNKIQMRNLVCPILGIILTWNTDVLDSEPTEIINKFVTVTNKKVWTGK